MKIKTNINSVGLLFTLLLLSMFSLSCTGIESHDDAWAQAILGGAEVIGGNHSGGMQRIDGAAATLR